MADDERMHPRLGLVERWWPWLSGLVWFGGLVVIGYYAQKKGWSTGEMVLAGCGWFLVPALFARNAIRNLFGPVFSYEILRIGRKKSTHILRFLYILGILAVFGLSYLSWYESTTYNSRRDIIAASELAKFATEFFMLYSGLQFVLMMLLTPAYVAGCIADEKERKTLEFLLATDLRAHEIVFGKMAARVLTLLMYVLAGLPILGFMQLFGGIDPDLLVASTTAVIITILGFSALSVYFSVCMKKPRDAIALTYLTAVLFLVLTGVGGAMLNGLQMGLTPAGNYDLTLMGYTFDIVPMVDWLNDAMSWLSGGNIIYVYGMLSIKMGIGSFNTAELNAALVKYAIFWGVTSCLLLAYCFTSLRSIALRQAYGGMTAPKTRVKPRKAAKPGEKATAMVEEADWPGRPAVGNDPMFWKEVYVEGSGKSGCVWMVMNLVILVLVFITPVICFLYTFGDWIPFFPEFLGVYRDGRSLGVRMEEIGRSMNWWSKFAIGIMSSLAMMGAAVRGAGCISGERDRDTWISLISTPLSAWDMLKGKWLGVVLGMRKLYFVMLLIWGLTLLAGGVDFTMVVASILALAIYVSAFAWMGILCSISARNTLIASIRAIMLAFIAGGGYWIILGLCCCFPLATVSRGNGGMFNTEPFNSVVSVLVGMMPPFVMGWAQLHDFTGQEYGPFQSRESSIGALAPLVGLLIWFIGQWVLMLMATAAFRKITNRDEDRLQPKLPPKKKPRPAPDAEAT
jgi:ABC-type transport system involved in multi-copper enzyme maturation permease subunit